MNRVLPAARLQLVTWPSLLLWPWGVLASSFVINLAVFAAIGDQIKGGPKTGGLLSIYITMLIIAAQTITQVFPFALGVSLTRRTFYASAALVLAGESVLFGVLLYLCELIEDATEGWGIDMPFFGLPFVKTDNPLAQILIYTVPLIVFGLLGYFVALIYKRWRINGVFIASIAALAGAGALFAFITWRQDWPAIGHWLTHASPISLFVGWPALLALVLVGAGYLVIRRTTP